MLHIGKVRRFFFVNGTHKWNAVVRDVTAWLERKVPWLFGHVA